MVNLEDLCIEPGVAVWVLYVDVVCLNYEGNVGDAGVLAVSAALRHGKHKHIMGGFFLLFLFVLLIFVLVIFV